MARRDVRWHKGRSALVLIMVSIPVALLVAIACWVAIEGLHGEDLILAQMGSGQALIQEPQEQKVAQTAKADTYSSDGSPAKPVPGYVQGEDNTAVMEQLVGGTLIPVADVEARFVKGERRRPIRGLVLDGRDADLGPKLTLVSGRWPRSGTEVLITPAGMSEGMPGKGSVTVSSGGEERRLHVVGTAEALAFYGSHPDFVVPSIWGSATTYGQSWILERDKPLLWPEVRSLNEHGILVVSAAVLRDPPSEEDLDPALLRQMEGGGNPILQLSVLGGVTLILVTILLAAPAFAVGSARQRRTLALAACNGAEVRQLRRSVLAKAVILGVAAAFFGAVVGAGGLRGVIALWCATHPDAAIGSFVIPWLAIILILACATLSTLVAALLPSLRLGRLDIVGVMRGQNVSPPVNRLLPMLGVLFVGGGGLLLIYSLKTGMGETVSAAGIVLLVGGAVLVVPILLVMAGRLASRLPVAARMATRDVARHRSRSTPTVAAILAGVAALTTMSIALASDTDKRAEGYVPMTLSGEGFVVYNEVKSKELVGHALRREAPGLVQTPLLMVKTDFVQPGAGATEPFVTAVAPGSTVQASLDPAGDDVSGTLGTQDSYDGMIVALPLAELARRLRLTAAERHVLAEGGVATTHAALIEDGELDMATGSWRLDLETGKHEDIVVSDRRNMPALLLPRSVAETGRLPLAASGVGGAVTVETARRLGWPLREDGVLLRNPSGSIDPKLADTLDEYLAEEASPYVERGFVRDDTLAMRVGFGLAGTLLLAVTLIATALSLAEQEPDMGTFAAVGATRGTRRRLAAAHAMTVGLVGAVLGVAVGLIGGVAVAYPLTAQTWDSVTGEELAADPALAVPWLSLLAVAIGAPLLAAALSAVAVRRAPEMTRRAD